MKVVGIRGYHVGFAPDPALGNASTFIRRRDFLLLQLIGVLVIKKIVNIEY